MSKYSTIPRRDVGRSSPIINRDIQVPLDQTTAFMRRWRFTTDVLKKTMPQRALLMALEDAEEGDLREKDELAQKLYSLKNPAIRHKEFASYIKTGLNASQSEELLVDYEMILKDCLHRKNSFTRLGSLLGIIKGYPTLIATDRDESVVFTKAEKIKLLEEYGPMMESCLESSIAKRCADAGKAFRKGLQVTRKKLGQLGVFEPLRVLKLTGTDAPIDTSAEVSPSVSSVPVGENMVSQERPTPVTPPSGEPVSLAWAS